MPVMLDCNFPDLIHSTPDGQLTFFDDDIDFPNVMSFESANPLSPSEQSTPQTVSPRDLMQDNLSAPGSSTLTDLTTPGTNKFESPLQAGSTDPSPNFGADTIDQESRAWVPLFGSVGDQPRAVAMTHSLSTDSATSLGSHLDVSPAASYTPPAPRMSKNHSSPGKKGTKSGQHASTFGVGARKRDKPLPAITVDDSTDPTAMKRAKNTMAARKSRQKRVEHQEQLETRIAILKAERDYWKSRALALGHVE